MRKFTKLLALAALLFVPWVTQAQNTLTTCEGTATNEYVPFYGYYADEAQNGQMIYPADSLTAMLNMDINSMTFYISSVGSGNGVSSIGNWIVSIGTTTETTLSGINSSVSLTEVYSGAMTFNSDNSQMTVTFATGFTYTGGNLLVQFNHPVAAGYQSIIFAGIDATGASYCYNGQRNFLPKVTFGYDNPPSCIRPSDLTASNITSDGLTLSWTDVSNTGASYSIDYWKNGGDTITVTSTTTEYTFSGLDANSLYNFAVKAVCSASDESTPLNGSFATACGSSTCDLTVYTDNTNYNYYTYCPKLTLYQNGINLGEVQGTTPQTIEVCSSDSVIVIYTEPNYSYYSSYATATILDGGGSAIFNGSTGSYSTGDVLMNITTPCPSCIPPKDLTVFPDSNQIEFSWTPRSGAEQFIVYLNDSLVSDNVADTFFVFTELTANTAYTVRVQSVCSDDDSSSIVSRSVRTACGAITLPYFVDFEDAAFNGAWYPCWDSVIHAGTDPSVNTVAAHNSTYGMYFQANSSEAYNLVVSPQVPTTGNNIYVRFWGYNTNTNWFKAGVISNPYDTSTFIPLVEIWGNSWNEYEFRTDTATAIDPTETYYVAWMSYKPGVSYNTQMGRVDDVYISEVPACTRVTEVALEEATETSLTLSWNTGGNTGANYTIKYWKDGTTDTLTANASDTTTTLTGLDASSAYKVSVIANCSAGDAEASPVFTFRTACGALTLPFFDNFDSYDNGFWPPCWNRLRAHGSDPSVNAQYHHSGTQSMFLLAENDTNLFCTPTAIPTTGNNIYVRYQAFMNWASYYNGTKWLKAGVMTDTSDVSTFIALDSLEYHNFNDVFEEREFTTAALDPSATYWVAWMFYSDNIGYGSYTRGAVDDVYISEIPSCMRVSDFAAGDADSASLTLTWIDTLNSGATYTITCTTNDSVVATGISGTTYTVTDLEANTTYTFSIVPDCGGETAEAVTCSGRTECAGYAIPYSEGFETADNLPCWIMAINSNNGGRTSGNASTGSYSYLFYYGSQPSYLISPILTGTENGLKVQFQYKLYSSYYDETFVVGYSTTNSDDTSFIWGDEITDATSNYQTFSAIYPAGTKYVCIKYTSYNNYGLYIDDIDFMLPPDCMPVSLLTLNTADATTATIRWTAPEGQSNFFVRLDTNEVINVSDTTYTFTGLEARTTYTAYVATDCDGDTSEWQSISFRTDCANGSCNVTVVSTADYVYSYYCPTIHVYQNGEEQAAVNASTQTVNVCAGMPVIFVNESANYDWDNPTATITDGDGFVFFDGSTSDYDDGDTLAVMLNACPTCSAPTGIVATAIDSTSLTFAWTMNEDVLSYEVSFNGGDYSASSTGSETYTMLTPNTTYTFSVRAICAAGDTSYANGITVKTACGSMVIPFTADFESDVQGEMPDCWNLVRAGYDGYPAVSGSEHTGNNGFTLAAAYNDSTTVATSLVPLAGDEILVSFWASVNNGNTLYAGVMTDLAADSTFIPLMTVPYNNSTYTHYEFTTSTLSSSEQYYVAFRLVTGSSNNYADLDDINIRLDAGCLTPTNLTGTAGAHTIDLAWTNNSAVSDFAIMYKPAGGDWSYDYAVDTTHTLSGLNAATSYEVRVGLACTPGDTLWTTSITVVTTCDLLPLPYEENFDAYAENVMPPCWEWNNSFCTHYDGGVFFRSYHGGGSEYVVLPQLDGNIAKLKIEFDAKVGTIAENDGILIGVADATGTLLAWLDTIQDVNYSRNAHVRKTVYFPIYNIPAGAARVTFAQFRNWNEWACIDNINIEELPSCYPVDNLTGHNLIDPEATSFTWHQVGTESQWQVYVDTVTVGLDSLANMDNSNFIDVFDTTYTIPIGAIQGGGIYNFFVRANCGTDQSGWVKKEFGAGTVIMNNSTVADTVEGCGFIVYDNGGPIAGYLAPSSSALVLRSENVGSQLKIFGGKFGFGTSPATLNVYDGENAVDSMLLYTYNTVSGRDTLMDTILAVTTTGSMTITFNVSGSSAHTGYELYVRCTEGAICPRPTELHAEMTSATTADVTWSGDAPSYHFYYSVSGTDLWTGQTVTGNNVTLTGLLADTTYDMYVVALCSGTDSSAASVTRQLFSHYEEIVTTQYTVTLLSADSTMGSVNPAGATVVDSANSFTIHAIANTGYHFVAWTEGGNTVATTEDYTFVVLNDRTLTATFEQNPPDTAWYTITVTANNPAMGTVTGGGLYAEGTAVTLTATANDGYRFVNWSNGDTTATITITVTGDATYTANFEAIPQYTVTVNFDATMGSVTGAGTYYEGTTVTLVATPNSGYHFVTWNDGVTTASRTITVTADVTYTATFEANSSDIQYYTVNASANDAAMGTVTGDIGTYEEGTAITLTAVANTGYRFVEWSNGDTSATITFTLTSNITLTANFEAIPQYTVTVNYNNAMGTVTGGGTFYEGTTITLTATPNNGYRFVDWNDGVTSATRTVVVTADVTYTANFQRDVAYYTVTVNYDATMGTVTGIPTEAVAEGTEITLSATAKNGYHFVGWSDGVTTATRTITVTSNVTLTANFAQDDPQGIDDVNSANIALYPNPATVMVTLSGLESMSTVTLVDLNGREAGKWTATSETLTIDVSDLAKGAYFVRIAGEHTNAIRKLIVR